MSALRPEGNRLKQSRYCLLRSSFHGRIYVGFFLFFAHSYEIDSISVGRVRTRGNIKQYNGLRRSKLTPACGSAHIRIGRGCRQIEAVNATVVRVLKSHTHRFVCFLSDGSVLLFVFCFAVYRPPPRFYFLFFFVSCSFGLCTRVRLEVRLVFSKTQERKKKKTCRTTLGAQQHFSSNHVFLPSINQ